jgi:hypothetical protein
MSTIRATNFQHGSAASPAIVLAPSGSATASLSAVNGGQLAGMLNAIINGCTSIDQRNSGNSQTITAGAPLAYTVDRWYAYCTGANVTGQRVQGASVGQFRYRFTGAASVTAIGFGQRIEQLDSAHLAGSTVTLGVDLANSVLTTVTWTAFYANSADTFGTLAAPTRTQIANGTFTVNSTVTRYSANINLPAAATTGIEIVFTVGAQTSGTWTIGCVQLEPGPVATPFERRSAGLELALCQRYWEAITPSNITGYVQAANIVYFYTPFLPKRATPSVSFANTAGNRIVYGPGAATDFNGTYAAETVRVSNTAFNVTTSTSVLSAGQAVRLQLPPTIRLDAEL